MVIQISAVSANKNLALHQPSATAAHIPMDVLDLHWWVLNHSAGQRLKLTAQTQVPAQAWLRSHGTNKLMLKVACQLNPTNTHLLFGSFSSFLWEPLLADTDVTSWTDFPGGARKKTADEARINTIIIPSGLHDFVGMTLGC